VPSPKAEPIKLWLAKVGYERMLEMADPALSVDRARQTWQQHGRSDKWIQQRMIGQETRNKLTDYWRSHEIEEGQEFAIPTGLIHQEWSGVSVKDHKKLKGLNSHNLRDHKTEAELIFTALAELSSAADWREHRDHRPADQQDCCAGGWRHRQAGTAATRRPDRPARGVG
jgi:DNA-damage-inducible protein D